jgi:hypothetical protein
MTDHTVDGSVIAQKCMTSFSAPIRGAMTNNKAVDDCAKQLLNILNAPDCGPVVGVSLGSAETGMLGHVMHGDAAPRKGAIPPGTLWTAKAFHQKIENGFITGKKFASAMKKAAEQACADPIGSTAVFMSACFSGQGAHVLLVSPGGTDLGTLSVDVFDACGTGMITDALFLKITQQTIVPKLVEVISTKAVVDVSYALPAKGTAVACGLAWNRAGGGRVVTSPKASIVKVPKRGALTFGKFQGCAGVAHDMIPAYKGPIFFDVDNVSVAVLGLVFHNDLPDQPPEVNIGQDSNPAVCCSVM